MHLYVEKKTKKKKKSLISSSKYKSLLNSDTWENDVLPELNNPSQIIDRNIPDKDYTDIQKDNILEHSFFMKMDVMGLDHLVFVINSKSNQISIIVSKNTSLINKKI